MRCLGSESLMQLKDYQVVGVLCLSVDSWCRYDIMIHGNVETAGDSFFL
jgi:hypothetical protein